MSLYQVQKLLRDVNCSAVLAKRCQSEPEAVLQQYNLTAEEKDALTNWRVRTLSNMGAHPLLLLVYSLALGKDIPTYLQALQAEK
jgi:hypothetical protein